jgi:hypothetical protein
MIFKTDIQEEELVIGEVETVESNIDISQNLAFVLDTVSSKFYSDPIGSIVREITSNCFDSHIEAGVDEPVVIKLYYNLESDGGYIIEFIDRGVGMNDQRFNKIYMNWFSSTKRDTNDQIGGWGLGSKSPFAYTNQFMITTIADGVKTSRLLSKLQGELPKAEVLYRQPSTEHNGTTIRIDIKNYTDANKFANAIKNQLRYFDNVFVDSIAFKFENDYRIYDCRNFKYRSGMSEEHVQSYSIREEQQKMHILLGNVTYPINWEIINMHPYSIPVGVKFNIGELQVTPNREALEYRDESVALIKERVNLAIDEVRSIFSKQNPVVEDFNRYLQIRDEIPRITFKPNEDSSVKDYLFVNSLNNLQNKICFLPLKEIEILPREFFHEYRFEYIENGIAKEKRRRSVFNNDIVNNSGNYHYAPYGITKYGNLFLRDGTIIVKRKDSWKDICELLDYKVWRSKSQHNSWYYQVSKKINANPPKLGSAIAVYKFRKFVENLIKERTNEYPTVTEEWIKEYRKRAKDNSAQTRRKQNQLVIVYNDEGKAREKPIAALQKARFVFYAMKDDSYEDQNNVFKYQRLISNQNKEFNFMIGDKKYDSKPFEFWIFNKTNLKLMKDVDNLVHIKDFFKVHDLQPILNRLYLAEVWKQNWKHQSYGMSQSIAKVSTYYAKQYEQIKYFIRKYQDSYTSGMNEILKENIVIKNHKCTVKVRMMKKELDQFLEKADVLLYIGGLPEKYQKVLINHSLKVTKLNKKYYGREISVQADRTESNSNTSGSGTSNQENS